MSLIPTNVASNAPRALALETTLKEAIKCAVAAIVSNDYETKVSNADLAEAKFGNIRVILDSLRNRVVFKNGVDTLSMLGGEVREIELEGFRNTAIIIDEKVSVLIDIFLDFLDDRSSDSENLLILQICIVGRSIATMTRMFMIESIGSHTSKYWDDFYTQLKNDLGQSRI